jgi:hypothetical protein
MQLVFGISSYNLKHTRVIAECFMGSGESLGIFIVHLYECDIGSVTHMLLRFWRDVMTVKSHSMSACPRHVAMVLYALP